MVCPLPNPKNPLPYSMETSRNTGLATSQHLKILNLSLGRDLHKTCYNFYQYPKYRSHSRETLQNASNFHNFSNIE